MQHREWLVTLDSVHRIELKIHYPMKTNPSEQVFEPLLNSREAGKLLGVHPATMKRLARAGKPPCVKVGKLWRFSVSQSNASVASGTTSSGGSR